MFKSIRRWFKKWSNRHLGTNFQNTVLGLEMVYSNLNFQEDETTMFIDGKVLVRLPIKTWKNRDGLFVIPPEIYASGKSYFIKYDGSIFLER